MKVKDTQNMNTIRDRADARSKGAVQSAKSSAATPTKKSEQVDISVSSAVEVAGSQRAERLRDLEAAIRGGTYKPDPNRIAEEILRDAELNARLKALL